MKHCPSPPKDVPMQPWHPTWALRMSAVLHVCSAVLVVVNPALWPWALGTVVANHLVLTAAVMRPQSRLLGPNMTRLPPDAARRGEVALTFDDGPDPEITPQVLDLLDEYGAKASFFCIAERVAAHPELAREIIRRGHTVENHTRKHSYAFPLFGPRALQREINAAQSTIHAITRAAPKFFRAPMGFRNPFLAPAVKRANLRYVSWTRRGYDTFAKHAEPVLHRLQQGLAAGDILLLHDGRPNQLQQNSPVILEVLPRLLKQLQALNLKSVSLAAAAPPDFNGLIDAATLPYTCAGKYAYHFAQGKLRHDPVFRAVLKNGLLPDEGRLLDLGCGLGVLPALLSQARIQHQAGNWFAGWPAPPQHVELFGIELLPWKVTAATQALGGKATIRQGDIRTIELPQCSCVVILDVLLYLNTAEQRQMLQRMAKALQPGGVLLLREGDAAGGLRFHITRLAEQICCLWRGQGWLPLHYRSAKEWVALLRELGFSVESIPMSQGTPFANVLFRATRVA